MKKKDKIILGIYIIIGIALIIMGITISVDYYSAMIFAMGVALTFNSVMQFLRFWHNTKPENAEKYQEKLRQQTIDLKDERKILLRNRAGYITWALSMISFFIASFIAALLRTDSIIVGILFAAGIAEYLVAMVVYKYLCRKM